MPTKPSNKAKQTTKADAKKSPPANPPQKAPVPRKPVHHEEPTS